MGMFTPLFHVVGRFRYGSKNSILRGLKHDLKFIVDYVRIRIAARQINPAAPLEMFPREWNEEELAAFMESEPDKRTGTALKAD